ncbi:hypothetical protein Tsubulata_021814 [Turnera subulata]|uniref:Cellulose synthase-like protein H1 n=1 Tax=Turnera subulata TaxID=218843 RepID=A0A9Q0F809_9ROSI|nr:hypothetical protein Tsubulata_021814 [Turnera subulata]
MADPVFSTPLYSKFSDKNIINRVLDVTILFLLLLVLVYRLFSLNKHGFAWFLAFLCESWFTFMWVLTISTKWNPVDYETYPERLSQRVEEELPPVDVFVTTADPTLEPPLITVNTVISLLAVDYPADKLACYVSDDGCSPLTFYSLVEASKFAKNWVPFCRKYNVQVRAPSMYFSNEFSSSSSDGSLEFKQECKKMKDEYEELSRKIDDATKDSSLLNLRSDLAVFSNTERRNHPSIIKVVWENKESLPDGLPHLIYISREKRPNHPHNYKAGAMNVLTRVSGLLTNAPYMLNVDCDMPVNNPQIVRQAMCLFLGSSHESDSGFVQFPQTFYGGSKDDPLGNQFLIWNQYMIRGFAGIQGPFYGGTGCFHRRKAIYGSCPNDIANQARNLHSVHVNERPFLSLSGDLSEKDLLKIFGNSMEFMKSADTALKEKNNDAQNLSVMAEEAMPLAGCDYENVTSWGTEIGWQYGSATEDVVTGLMIHARGWRTILYMPDPPAFLGCAPPYGPTTIIQMKRWTTGWLEILFSEKSPIFATLKAKLQLRECLAYLYLITWGARSIPELCYSLLPAYCIITNSSFLPRVTEPAGCIYLALFTVYNLYTLREYLLIGLSSRGWWNNHRMMRINAVSAWLFGLISVVLKILGISETVFEVTQKDSSNDEEDAGRFTFNASPIFVPPTTLLLLQPSALAINLVARQPSSSSLKEAEHGTGFGELLCCVWLVMCFWPFARGLLAKEKYGIPLPTIFKSAFLTLAFVHLCKRAS